MDLFFNELSIKNLDQIDGQAVFRIVNVYKELLKYHIRTCRISHDDNIRLFQMIRCLPDSVNIRNFIFLFSGHHMSLKR